MLKKIFADSFIYAFLPKLPMVISIFILPITTKYLTPNDYGIYGVIMAYFGALSGFRELGMGVNLSNVFFKHPKFYKIVWRNLLGFYYVWGIIFALLTGLLLLIIVPEEALEYRTFIMFLVLFPLIFFAPISRIGTLYYQYKRKPLTLTSISIGTALVAMATTFYCIVYLKLGYVSWFISSCISATLPGIIYYYIFTIKKKFTPIFRFNKLTYRRYLKIGLPVVPHQYAGYLLNSSDRMVMDIVGVNNDNIGRYNFSYTFGSLSQQVTEGVNKGVMPYYMKLLASNEKNRNIKYRNLTFLIQAITLVCSFIGCLWLKEIFGIMVSNDELRKMYPLAVIIIMSFNFNAIYQSINTQLSFHEKTTALWKISFVAGILNIGLNMIFIPMYGYKVAAITTLISLLYVGFAGLWFKSFKRNEELNYYGIVWIIIILLSAFSVYLMVDLRVSIKLIITTSIFIGLFSMKNKIKSIIHVINN